MQRSVEAAVVLIHKVVRTEPVQMLVDTAEVVVETGVDMLVVLELAHETHWVLYWQQDTELIVDRDNRMSVVRGAEVVADTVLAIVEDP